MAAKLENEESAGAKEKKEVTFKCKICERPRPLSEMVVLTGYFPPIVACRECEEKMR